MIRKLLTVLFGIAGAVVCRGAAVDSMTNNTQLAVTSIAAKQRYPWNGKVDIDFSFTSTVPEAFAFIHFKARYVNRAGETVEVPMKTFEQFSTAFCTNAGSYRVTWDATADAPALKVTNLEYTVTANMAKYMVIDLSKGTKATADNPYPISYYEDVPDFPGVEKGKWDDYHKTTNLVLRLIQPGTYRQGWSDLSDNPADCRRSGLVHTAVITKPFYLAVFEMTQEQLYLLKSSYGQSSIFTGGRRKLRPAAENYQNIRGIGYNGTINWPITGYKVLSSSLLGKLRERTGTEGFDLPTESEWEYACRAGGAASGFWNDGSDAGISTSTKFNTVKNGNEALEKLGRYRHNGGMVKTWDEVGETNIYTAAAKSCDESLGTAVVGSYEPNAWGLYDMHGNEGEWCNGIASGTYYYWYNSDGYYCKDDYPVLVDDLGASSATWGEYSYRSYRGGSYSSSARDCIIPLRKSDTERTYHGIRLCWRFPTPPQK